MKTVILISTPLGLEKNVIEIKIKIINYLGSRLVHNNPDESPVIALNCLLETPDKEAVLKIGEDVLTTATILFIELSDNEYDKFGNCTLQIKDETV